MDARRGFGFLLLGLALGASRLPAQPVGNVFAVGASDPPSVAPIGQKGYVVVWQASDGSQVGAFGQRLDLSGNNLGAVFRVNTYTTGGQYFPAVASDPTGQFVVVWYGDGSDGGTGIFGQRYDSNGVALGGEFHVNGSTTLIVGSPSVASDGAGQFVVAWEVADVDDNVFARRFQFTGAPLGSSFRVNTTTTGAQEFPRVAAWPGGFVVVWESGGQAGEDGRGVFGQRYDASQSALGGEFHVNAFTTGDQYNPDVSSRFDGSFVVVWESATGDGSGEGIRGRRYDTSGAAQGTGFQVNTYTTNAQYESSVAVDEASGTFVVTWSSTQQAPDTVGIHAQLFDAAANALGAEYRVNTAAIAQQPRAAASHVSGRYLIAWDGAARNYALVGDANGDGTLTVADVFHLINRIFAGGPVVLPSAVGDVNADGSVNVSDVFYLINFLFAGGPPPI